jgi:hypothetical protein
VIDAQEALRIGLVNKLVPHEDLSKATREFALKFVKNAPIPIALAKKALQNYARLDLAQALDHEQIAQEICRKTEDRAEGMKSFVEKREPGSRKDEICSFLMTGDSAEFAEVRSSPVSFHPKLPFCGRGLWEGCGWSIVVLRLNHPHSPSPSRGGKIEFRINTS